MNKNPLEHRWSNKDEQELREIQKRLSILESKRQESRESWVSDFRLAVSLGVAKEDYPYVLYDNRDVRDQVRRLFYYRDAVNAEIPIVRELNAYADKLLAVNPVGLSNTQDLLRRAAEEIENRRLRLEAKL